MAKVLRCPACGAGEDALYADQSAVLTYAVHVNPDASDGIETTDEALHLQDEWNLGCGHCGATSDGGDFWTEGWLVEEEPDGDDQ